MSVQQILSPTETSDDPRKIGKWARVYAQNRTWEWWSCSGSCVLYLAWLSTLKRNGLSPGQMGAFSGRA